MNIWSGLSQDMRVYQIFFWKCEGNCWDFLVGHDGGFIYRCSQCRYSWSMVSPPFSKHIEGSHVALVISHPFHKT